jgi:hypothetical protein
MALFYRKTSRMQMNIKTVQAIAIRLIACIFVFGASFAGSPGSQPITPQSWTVINWYVNPSVGLDTNSCISSGSPCATFGEIFIHRLGTISPTYTQATTFTLQSSQSGTNDPIFFTPKLANGGQAVLIGTPITVAGSPFIAGTVTTQVQGAPGTRWQVAGMPAASAAKQLLFDSTTNAYAFIDSIAGSVATITQPLPSSLINTVGLFSPTESTFATGDTITAYTLPTANLKVWRPQGGDVGSGGANTSASVGWVQFIQVADSSGTGESELPVTNDAATLNFSAVQFLTRVHINILGGRGYGVSLVGCDTSQVIVVFGGGSGMFYGGVVRNGMVIAGGATPDIEGDVAIHGTLAITSAFVNFINVFSDGVLQATYGMMQTNGGVAWGSFSVVLYPGSVFYRVGGTSWATTLKTTGSLGFGSNSSGSYFSGSTWTSGITISAANIDTNDGLQNPQTGAKFSNSQ